MKRSLLLLSLIAAVACAEKKEVPHEEAVPVTVATVQQKDMPLGLQAIGNVQPLSTVAVRALVEGQLLNVSFHEGDDVTKGQVLFTIDSRPYAAALQQAQANLQRDEAQLRNGEANAARYADLVKKDYVTKEEYDRIASGAEAARAVAAADRAAAENARLQLSYCTIRAPLSGRTGSLQVHAGNLVHANDTTPLVVINQVEPVYVQFSVPQDQLAQIRAASGSGAGGGKTLDVVASPPNAAAQAHGKLSFVDNAVDTTTGTITLKALFDNRDRALWPGQFVTVAMTIENRPSAIVVPARAVQTGQKGQYVYVVKPGNAVEMRPISVFRTIGQETIVADGLNAGETVVTDGQLRLTPKSKVEIKG
jgi:membrane fusion protein, multidrug efflux system